MMMPTPQISPARTGQSLPLDTAWDWRWSDGFLPEVRRILTMCALHLFEFSIATAQQDMKQATDMTVKITSSHDMAIAVRLRRAQYQHRDLTIRAARRSGVPTELGKIREGAGDFYLYGWTDAWTIREWMLIDLHKLRASGILMKPRHVYANKDQTTGFIAISHGELRSAGCVVRSSIGGR
jgi:hypothetical protein